MGRATRRLTARGTVWLWLVASVSGCALAPRDGGAPSAPRAIPTEPPAVSRAGPAETLLAQSRAARDAGDYAAAETALERAVRIDPNEPALWLEYGVLKLTLGDFDQALTLARRATDLAGDNRDLRAAASRLIADANRERARAAAAAGREAELH